MSQFLLRPAQAGDEPFLVRCVLEAEASGTGQSTYERVFDLTRKEAEDLILKIFQEDQEGFEMCRSSFLVYEADGRPVAGCAAWIEAHNGLPGASTLRAQSLAYFLGAERWQVAKPRLEAVAAVSVPRKAGYLQLESFYVDREYQGHSLAIKLLKAQEDRYLALPQPPTHGQILVWGHHDKARILYERQGYELETTRKADPDAPPPLTPAAKMWSLEKSYTES
jgi:GNAT superfamily N-acetyltransferase